MLSVLDISDWLRGFCPRCGRHCQGLHCGLGVCCGSTSMVTESETNFCFPASRSCATTASSLLPQEPQGIPPSALPFITTTSIFPFIPSLSQLHWTGFRSQSWVLCSHLTTRSFNRRPVSLALFLQCWKQFSSTIKTWQQSQVSSLPTVTFSSVCIVLSRSTFLAC